MPPTFTSPAKRARRRRSEAQLNLPPRLTPDFVDQFDEVQLPPLVVEIIQAGEVISTIEVRDPRADLCNRYNAAQRWVQPELGLTARPRQEGGGT